MKNTYSANPETETIDTVSEIDEKLTGEEQAEILLPYENDILAGLMAAANFCEDEEEIVTIDIERGRKRMFSFRIHPLSEDQYTRCREENTKYVRNKNIGVRVAEKTNAARFRSCLIYEATVEEDRKKLWQNKDAWHKLNVLNGPDLISRVLKAGEKDAICDKLDEISGYQSNQLETVKN